MSEKVDQKEYLKKYLSGPKKKKVKKLTSRMKILDYSEMDKNFNLDEDPLELTGEDAPQIVSIHEDAKGCVIESNRTQLKWKKITNHAEKQIQDLGSTKRNKKIKCVGSDSEGEIKKQKIVVRDLSPPRKTIMKDLSPPRKSINSNTDIKSKSVDYKRDEDISPIRRKATQEKTEKKTSRNISHMEPVVHRTTKKQSENPEKVINEKINEKTRNLYQQWGKGVKQVESYKEKYETDLYEGSKPLARYSDDADLERFLKEQDRHGDPMQAYINKKTTKNNTHTATYKGFVPENRFNIKPGYRWDGVNRSNGYEEKYFEQQSNRKINLNSTFFTEDF